jgi:hypothetical protein
MADLPSIPVERAGIDSDSARPRFSPDFYVGSPAVNWKIVAPTLATVPG